MRKLIASAQMSLDGFSAGPDGAMDWLIGGDEEWKEMLHDLKAVDTILLGANMYPGYASYWRATLHNTSADPNERAYAEFANRTPHILFSHSLSTVDWENTRIAKDPKAEVEKLKAQSGGNLITWGGTTTISGLMNMDLVDEFRITLNPIVLGGGLPLFKDVGSRNRLRLISARQFSSGAMLLRYEVVK